MRRGAAWEGCLLVVLLHKKRRGRESESHGRRKGGTDGDGGRHGRRRHGSATYSHRPPTTQSSWVLLSTHSWPRAKACITRRAAPCLRKGLQHTFRDFTGFGEACVSCALDYRTVSQLLVCLAIHSNGYPVSRYIDGSARPPASRPIIALPSVVERLFSRPREEQPIWRIFSPNTPSSQG